MISDEERREVAARMREIMRRSPNCFLDNMVARSVNDVMVDGMTIGETVADLIDRPTCRNIYAETVKVGTCENGFKCSECGNTVEDYEGYRVSGEFNYCSKCGAIVVGRKPTRMEGSGNDGD